MSCRHGCKCCPLPSVFGLVRFPPLSSLPLLVVDFRYRKTVLFPTDSIEPFVSVRSLPHKVYPLGLYVPACPCGFSNGLPFLFQSFAPPRVWPFSQKRSFVLFFQVSPRSPSVSTSSYGTGRLWRKTPPRSVESGSPYYYCNIICNSYCFCKTIDASVLIKRV